ncbi:hypothetical protein [Veronia pacifica]|uniref:Uncharacterized protein n=1 Tax=Veronia pacifica TaxID=1080227 RepID=A0A1C3EQS7_9GAMM|nr:hypothetical protein [Veronia pacifica]ODA35598.1 hypothetical protein A8L45_02945 [Veronia pacifica]
MSNNELVKDPVVQMLLEDVKKYLSGDKSIMAEAKRSISLLRKEYDIGPWFICQSCEAELAQVSEIW